MPIHFDHSGAGILTISAPASGNNTFDGSLTGGVTSVNGMTGSVTLSASDVGITNATGGKYALSETEYRELNSHIGHVYQDTNSDMAISNPDGLEERTYILNNKHDSASSTAITISSTGFNIGDRVRFINVVATNPINIVLATGNQFAGVGTSNTNYTTVGLHTNSSTGLQYLYSDGTSVAGDTYELQYAGSNKWRVQYYDFAAWTNGLIPTSKIDFASTSANIFTSINPSLLISEASTTLSLPTVLPDVGAQTNCIGKVLRYMSAVNPVLINLLGWSHAGYCIIYNNDQVNPLRLQISSMYGAFPPLPSDPLTDRTYCDIPVETWVMLARTGVYMRIVASSDLSLIDSTLDWSKIDKTGASPEDIGAAPITNPVINGSLTVDYITSVNPFLWLAPDKLRICTAEATLPIAPTTSTDTGVLGEVRFASDEVAVCTATNTWKSVPLVPTGTISATELGHLDGVTSNIQTQLNGKQSSLGYSPVPETRKVNNKPLSADITLAASDVGITNATGGMYALTETQYKEVDSHINHVIQDTNTAMTVTNPNGLAMQTYYLSFVHTVALNTQITLESTGFSAGDRIRFINTGIGGMGINIVLPQGALIITTYGSTVDNYTTSGVHYNSTDMVYYLYNRTSSPGDAYEFQYCGNNFWRVAFFDSESTPSDSISPATINWSSFSTINISYDSQVSVPSNNSSVLPYITVTGKTITCYGRTVSYSNSYGAPIPINANLWTLGTSSVLCNKTMNDITFQLSTGVFSNGTNTIVLQPFMWVELTRSYTTVMQITASSDPLLHSTIGDAPLDGKMYQRQDGQWVEDADAIESPISKTYIELTDMVTNNLLVVGQQYILTDFRTEYVLPYTTDLLSTTANPAPEERLLLTAITTNSFNPTVLSLDFPKDLLMYEFVDSTTSGGDRGRITYRKDTVWNITMHEDWRNTFYRRWEATIGAGDWINYTDPGNGEAWQDFRPLNYTDIYFIYDVTINQSYNDWVGDRDISTTVYSNSVFICMGDVTSVKIGAGYCNSTIFSTGSGCRNLDIGSLCHNNIFNVTGGVRQSSIDNAFSQNTITIPDDYYMINCQIHGESKDNYIFSAQGIMGCTFNSFGLNDLTVDVLNYCTFNSGCNSLTTGLQTGVSLVNVVFPTQFQNHTLPSMSNLEIKQSPNGTYYKVYIDDSGATVTEPF